MPTKKQTPPQWIIVCLGDDLNWWLDKVSLEFFKASSEVDKGKGARGLLDALDRDHYFSSEHIHCFDEINEILQWSPA